MEKIHERFLRWVLGVEGFTPGYLVREELQREKLQGRAERRAWGYERKLEDGRGGELAILCLAEMRGGGRRGEGKSGGWEAERRGYFEMRGWDTVELARNGGVGMLKGEEMVKRDRSMEEEERWNRIGDSRYGKWYKFAKGEGIPGYLKKGWVESRWQRMAKFRLGGGMRGVRYWLSGEENRCRVCGGEKETWKHVWERCVGGGGL